MRFISLLILVTITSLPIRAGGQIHTVALTFDDLPLADDAGSAGMSPFERLATEQAVNRTILAGLHRHHAPAIGFVNEKKVIAEGPQKENREILREWIVAGNELGNHTFSHADLSKISAGEFEKEIVDGEASIKPLMAEAGKPLRYLRFPFNHTGETAEKQLAVSDFLKQHQYEVATCTIDNSDWVFARAYGVMLTKGDSDSMRRLRAAYLVYTEKEIDYYSQLHQQIFGREVPQVMLLHANRLNADTIDELLKIFERLKYKFVTLSQAQSDPAYRTPDTFVTAEGWMWGYRWARELNIKVDGRQEPQVPAWITQAYELR
jgi:peptidoglycan/xylan/chitin deacetylase (PgdA/CDA1 family)